MENSVIAVLKRRIQELGLEARRLVGRRDTLNGELHDIDIRLTHITGAMTEMDKLVKMEESREAKNDSEPTVEQVIPETDGLQPADDDSVQDKEVGSDS